MTEKTLDEKVAEALGFITKRLEFCTIIQVGIYTENCDGFFTESIANCKKYIEPVLLSPVVLGGFSLQYHKEDDGSLFWDIVGTSRRGYGYPRQIFSGIEKTAMRTYCVALLDMKEREKCQI